MTYADFITTKSQFGSANGFEPLWMPDFLKDFQSSLAFWAIKKGRSAILADCGMGKTPMLLVWAQNVVMHTNRPVLILTPLAVSHQTVREGDKFGVECERSTGKYKGKIVVANYEQLHKFTATDFAGVVCDEISCMKAMDGKLRAEATEFLRVVPYRLGCTATAAPNDYTELGTISEALGEMGQMDMIAMFFKQETKKDYLGWGRTKYRMRGHAEKPFWKFVASWARACRKPSDLGFNDDEFILPPLEEKVHIVQSRTRPEGWLFDVPARDMQEERAERRRTINERCEKIAELVNHGDPSIVWCHLNPEGDLLEKLIPNSVQVAGSDSTEAKEEAYLAFLSGQIKKLITKPKIGAWGLNFQHCADVATFSSHSYEQYYQLVRRCWRFGQKRTVKVAIVATEGEQRVSENLARKAKAANRMFSELVKYMNDAQKVEKSHYTKKARIPAWVS